MRSSVACLAAYNNGYLHGAWIDTDQDAEDIDQAETALQDCYHGQFASFADVMEEVTIESVTIPEALRYYIDWEAMARDAEMGGEFFTIEIVRDEVHVFSGR